MHSLRKAVAAAILAGGVLVGPLTEPLATLPGPGAAALTSGPAAQPRAATGPPEHRVAPSRSHASRYRPGRFGVRSHRRYFRVFAHPRWSATERRLASRNPIGQRLVLLATARRGRWVEVLLPVRPNGTTGWVHLRAVAPVARRQRIVVDLSERTLRHLRGDRVIHRFRVGIGTPATPTPRGAAFVWARVPQADAYGPYGVYALGLSSMSPVLTDWPGGGRAAIHGTADPSDRGRAVSHGCVRIYNRQMAQLTRVPMGTPVSVRA